MNGLRIGTPELVRLGMKTHDMAELASLIAEGLSAEGDHDGLAARVTTYRSRFAGVHFTA